MDFLVIKDFLLSYGPAYFAVISILSVLITVADKVLAKCHKWRVPEKTLFIFSILGGSAAMYITMQIIRHKTRHKRFMIGIPLIFAIQLILLLFIFLYQ